MLTRRFSIGEIARERRRHRSTIDREVRRNRAKYDGAYRPMFAIKKANGCRRPSHE
jgi:IS30 family transposase